MRLYLFFFIQLHSAILSLFMCCAFFSIPLPFHYLKMNESLRALGIVYMIFIFGVSTDFVFQYFSCLSNIFFHKNFDVTTFRLLSVGSFPLFLFQEYIRSFICIWYCDDVHHLHNVFILTLK